MPAPLFRDCAHTLSFRLCGRGSGGDQGPRTPGGSGGLQIRRRGRRWRGRCGPSAEGVAEDQGIRLSETSKYSLYVGIDDSSPA